MIELPQNNLLCILERFDGMFFYSRYSIKPTRSFGNTSWIIYAWLIISSLWDLFSTIRLSITPSVFISEQFDVPMTLFRSPNELLLSVTSYLVLQKDINSFAQANTNMYKLLNIYLYVSIWCGSQQKFCSSMDCKAWTRSNSQEVDSWRS